MKKWPNKDILYLRENYETKTNNDICRFLSRSKRAVSWMAYKLRLKKNEETISRAKKHTNINLTKEILEREYDQNCKSIRKIAKEFGLGKETVRYYLKKYSITRRSISEANKEFYNGGGKVWKTGLTKDSDKRIALATAKMRETYTKRRVDKLKEKERKFGKSLKEVIWKLYSEEKLTQEKIAKRLDLSRLIIIRLMKEYGLQKRPNFEYISCLKGEKHPQFGKKWEELYGQEKAAEMKAKRSIWSRENIIRRLKNREMPFKETKIEKKVMNELEKRKIGFVPQYEMNNKFVCDFAIPSHKIIVECDGDYWHANPKLYKTLNKTQKRKVQIDKFKDEYLKRKGWIVIRFFETDIKKSASKCIDLVEEQIKKIANPFDNLGMQN